MNKTAIYPGTFDPITYGHSDLVSRAAQLFDRVIVAVADSTAKKTVFTTEQRIELAKLALAKKPNIEVMSFDGLLVNFAQQHGVQVIIRGLRAVSDFEFEFQLANMNRKLMPNIETLFMTPSEHHAYVSSTLVREIASLGGDVSQFVAPEVAKALSNLTK